MQQNWKRTSRYSQFSLVSRKLGLESTDSASLKRKSVQIELFDLIQQELAFLNYENLLHSPFPAQFDYGKLVAPMRMLREGVFSCLNETPNDQLSLALAVYEHSCFVALLANDNNELAKTFSIFNWSASIFPADLQLPKTALMAVSEFAACYLLHFTLSNADDSKQHIFGSWPHLYKAYCELPPDLQHSDAVQLVCNLHFAARNADWVLFRRLLMEQQERDTTANSFFFSIFLSLLCKWVEKYWSRIFSLLCKVYFALPCDTVDRILLLDVFMSPAEPLASFLQCSSPKICVKLAQSRDRLEYFLSNFAQAANSQILLKGQDYEITLKKMPMRKK